MSIVILVGGSSAEGNPEHRYLVGAFLDRFGDQITRIVTAEPVNRSFGERLTRMLKRGNYLERFARWRYEGEYGPNAVDLQRLLEPNAAAPVMPGDNKRTHVASHNSRECEAILDEDKPDVIVVYGTRIIQQHIFKRAGRVTLNMHTGLSPYYRGDSTLFWPIYNNAPDHLGVTVHELAGTIDGGDIAATATVPYTQGDREADLFAKGVKAGTAIYLDCVQAALDDTLECYSQELSLGQEYRWTHRTVAAERRVTNQLDQWAQTPP